MASEVNQVSNFTAYNRTPDVFARVKEIARPARILSFGCSTGEETNTLANLYFPDAIIHGIDINRDIISQNRARNSNPRISYFADMADLSGTYDAIFCMSVLCRWPDNQSDYTFHAFQKSLMDIDKLLSIGGHLIIYNGQYRFSDTVLSAAYTALPMAGIDTGFVIKYDPFFRRLTEPYAQCIFRKRSIVNLPYGVITVTMPGGANIGDDIQTLAAVNFLRKQGVSTYHFVNREALNTYTGPPCYLLMNGWFTHNIVAFPPPPHVIPLFISFHCAREELIRQNVRYFQDYSPIGCRDRETVKLFRKYNIDAYFTGCLTLTFDPHSEKGTDEYIVDINTCSYIPRVQFDLSGYLGAVRIEHDIPKERCPADPAERLAIAEELLDKYRRAKHVVTSRLHCALPCRAVGTPVTFVHRDICTDPRFSGLVHVLGDKTPTISRSHVDHIVDNFTLRQRSVPKGTVFMYWDGGYENMPSSLQYIYDHNVRISQKYGFNIILLTDSNIQTYINIPRHYWRVAPNFKSDIVRFLTLHKFGGIWLDTDIIITKDLSRVYNALETSGKDAIVDVEFGTKIGCASLVMLPGTTVSYFCKEYVLNTLFKKGDSLNWDDIGPTNITNAVRALGDRFIVNDHSVVSRGCNYICWNERPGHNHTKWRKSTAEEAREISSTLLRNSACNYIVTWTIYRDNNIRGDVTQYFLKDPLSIFSHIISDSEAL